MVCRSTFVSICRRAGERDPKAIHEKLMAAGALELGPEAIERFRRAKAIFTERRASAEAAAPVAPVAPVVEATA